MTDDQPPQGPPPRDQQPLSPGYQWLLISSLTLLLVGIPAMILVWPPTLLSFRDAYLALSLLPGLLLGAIGVWLALQHR